MRFFGTASLVGLSLVALACSQTPNGPYTGSINPSPDGGSIAVPSDVRDAPSQPHSLAVDGRSVYFTDGALGGSVKTYSLELHTEAVIYTATSGERLGWPVTTDANNLYFVGRKDAIGLSTIYSLPLGGGDPKVAWEGSMVIRDVAVDDTYLY